MVNAKDIFNVLFKISYGKTVVFLIAALFFIAFLLIREKRFYYGLTIVIGTIFLIAANYTQTQEPYFDYDSEIVMGNSSRELSDENYERFEYISDHFIIVKRSNQDTPSRWDIDDKNIDNNRNYWQTHAVKPYWDVSVIVSNDSEWTVFHVELYYPRNGIDPLGSKHEHDWEFFELYYYMNETVPTYIAFPTYTDITEHPRVIAKWEELTQIGELYAIRLDPQTNAFHEDWDKIPTSPSHNFRPTMISPEPSETFEYLSQYEKLQVYCSVFAFILIFAYAYVTDNFRPRYYFILFVCIIFATYHLLTLQYDYVGNPSFRVWTNGEHFDDSPWYESQSGRDYINDYGGLPHDRDRWTRPAFDEEIGLKI